MTTQRNVRDIEEYRCEDDAISDDICDSCGLAFGSGAPVYWISDGGLEPRDGTYMCRICIDAALKEQGWGE